jgi:hypothetical protein
MIVKSPIISCSRRTDIPAFLMDWVIDKIKQRYVDVINPFNKNQVSRVSLSPKDVKCWVWWSKNFEKWIKAYNSSEEFFKQYKGHYFQFTINSPSELETNLKISLKERFKQFDWLVNEFGTQAVSFRYDPIIFYKIKGSNEIRHNLHKFDYIVENIAQFGLKEMIFSFANLYPKVKKRMNARGKIPLEFSFKKKKEVLQKLQRVCNKFNMKMLACCQPGLLEIEGIEQAHCIDASKLGKLIREPIPSENDTGQRKDCGCHKSKDIGGYTGIFKCVHDCEYCYASPRMK